MTDESIVHFKTARAGSKKLRPGTSPAQKTLSPRIPRISHLMALAIHFDGLIRKGTVRDYADLARLGGVSRARITQIMNLLNLPPWKQEELLFLNEDSRVTEREVRSPSTQKAAYCSCFGNTNRKDVSYPPLDAGDGIIPSQAYEFQDQRE